MGNIPFKVTGKSIVLLQERQQQILGHSQSQQIPKIDSIIRQLKDKLSTPGPTVDPDDEAIKIILHELRTNSTLLDDSFDIVWAAVCRLPLRDLYPQDSESLRERLADFIKVDGKRKSPTDQIENFNVDKFIKELTSIMEVAIENGTLLQVIQNYLNGEKILIEIETQVLLGEALLSLCDTGPVGGYLYNKVVKYSESKYIKIDLKNDCFIGKIKSEGFIINPLFSDFGKYVLDYSAKKPRIVTDNKGLGIHVPQGACFPEGKLCRSILAI